MNQNELEQAQRIANVLEMTAKTLLDVLAEFKQGMKVEKPTMDVAGYPLSIDNDIITVGELDFPRDAAIQLLTRFLEFNYNFGGVSGISVSGGQVLSIEKLTDILEFIEFE